MSSASTITAIAGVNFVKDIVTVNWGSNWYVGDGELDEGVDGIINIYRHKSGKRILVKPIVYVQIKSGRGFVENINDIDDAAKTHIKLNIGNEYIAKHRGIWHNSSGPFILIWVDFQDKLRLRRAWWADLKEPNTFSKTNKSVVLIPKVNRFAAHTKGLLIKKFCPSIQSIIELIALDEKQTADSITLQRNRNEAKQFYFHWSRSESKYKIHPTLGEVGITRAGWRRITGNQRSHGMIQTSFLLLIAARQAILTVPKLEQKRPGVRKKQNGLESLNFLYALHAIVELSNKDKYKLTIKLLNKIETVSKTSSTRTILLNIYGDKI